MLHRHSFDAGPSTRFHPSQVETLRHELEPRAMGRKGERTRARMLLACAQILEERGFASLRAADIARAAGASPAAFYRYFPNRRVAATQVLERFAERLYDIGGDYTPIGLGPGALHSLIEERLTSAAANPGLLRTLGQAAHDLPALAEIVVARRRAWVASVADCLAPAPGAFEGSGALDVFDALMTGALDQIARRLVSADQTPGFAARIAEAWIATAHIAAGCLRYS